MSSLYVTFDLSVGLFWYYMYKEILISILEAISNGLLNTPCAKLNKHSMQQFDKLFIQCLVMKKKFMPGLGTRIKNGYDVPL